MNNKFRNIIRPFSSVTGPNEYTYTPSEQFTLDAGLIACGVRFDQPTNTVIAFMEFIGNPPAADFVMRGGSIKVAGLHFAEKLVADNIASQEITLTPEAFASAENNFIANRSLQIIEG